MERSNPSENTSSFSGIFRVLSKLLIEHGDLRNSWERMRDSESSLGIPRDADTSFQLDFRGDALRHNPHGFRGIITEFVPVYVDEDGDTNPDILFAEVEVTDDLTVAFFVESENGTVSTVVDTTVADRIRNNVVGWREGDQLNSNDVELLRKVYETIQVNLA